MRSASVIIPTRARLNYLEVALASIAPQAVAAGADVLVIDDAGASTTARRLVERFGARYEPHPAPLGLNAARNTGVQRSDGELVVFVDDDIRADPGWLGALIGAAHEHPEVDLFTGPIRPYLEGPGLRSCGGEAPPITSLDLGGKDTRARYAWGANMAIRRSALERVGQFDITLGNGGDEQEWQDRLAGGTEGSARGDSPAVNHRGGVLYVARAGVDHRRVGADARLPSLARTAYTRGRAARRLDVRRGGSPPLNRELATLGGCLGHVIRRRCLGGLTMVAHSTGRLQEGLQIGRAHV
jgi:glycosyltransferase involved in cell wall biosynthesis